MPRRILRKLSSKVDTIRDRWYFRPFGDRLADPRLWSVQRRSVTGAFAAGLAICFVPLPIHIPLSLLVAILARVNVPVIIGTVFLVNPFTVVPVYYAAYRLGVLLLGWHVRPFTFQLSWSWLQYGLGPLWKPFLLGCAASSLLCSVLGWFALETIWRRRVRRRYRHRRAAAHARAVPPRG
jgi:uncharacterized protein (DUF2062 family)